MADAADAKLPIEMRNGVPCLVDANGGLWVIDTAATISVTKKPPSSAAPSGHVVLAGERRPFWHESFGAGSAAFRLVHDPQLPFAAGILGLDAIASMAPVVELDFEKLELRLSAAFAPTPAHVPLALSRAENGLLHVECQIGAHASGTFLLDTGAANSIVFKGAASDDAARLGACANKKTLRLVGDRSVTACVETTTIAVGGVALPCAVAVMTTSGDYTQLDTKACKGLLGADALRATLVLLLSDNRAWLLLPTSCPAPKKSKPPTVTAA